MSCISMDTILFFEHVVHLYSYRRYKVLHTGMILGRCSLVVDIPIFSSMLPPNDGANDDSILEARIVRT